MCIPEMPVLRFLMILYNLKMPVFSHSYVATSIMMMNWALTADIADALIKNTPAPDWLWKRFWVIINYLYFIIDLLNHVQNDQSSIIIRLITNYNVIHVVCRCQLFSDKSYQDPWQIWRLRIAHCMPVFLIWLIVW